MYVLPNNVFVVPVVPVCIKILFHWLCLCMLEVISSFSLKAGSQVFTLLVLILCVILHTMRSD